MFTLIYNESGETRRYELRPGSTTVGRSPGCNLVIDHVTVSRMHARFDVTDTSCVINDLGSSNGTFRNNEPITTSALSDGDKIAFGKCPAEIEQSAADRLAFSENHAIIEDSSTIFRPIYETREPTTDVAVATDAKRLLRLMSEVAGTLIRSQPLSEVLNQVVDLTFDTIPAERAFLILLEGDSGELVPRVVRDRRESTKTGKNKSVSSISRTIVNRVLTDRVAILADDAQMDAALQSAQSVLVQAVRSFMCAPLWHQTEVIGLLYVDTSQSKRFTPADLNLFTALSNYAAVAIEQARLSTRLLEETKRRERLQRYHSPSVVGRILESGDDAEAPFITQERDVTVLFGDIVGFTTLAEGLAPSAVAQLLNTYLGTMSDLIFEQEGTLDKFIGDAIMAVFGAPLDQPDHALRAVRTAQGMRKALARLNEGRAVPIQMRIGLNSGMALAGDMGSPKRREYTVLGDVVNAASRLEHIAEPGEIVISRATFERLNGQVPVRSRGKVSLRGRTEEMETFAVVE